MTRFNPIRSTAGLAALTVGAGIASAAWAAAAPDERPLPRRAAVAVGTTTPQATVDRAVALAASRAGVAPSQVRVHRAGGPLEAVAQVAAVAAEDPAAVIAVGRDARAAARQAQESELAPRAAWLTVTGP